MAESLDRVAAALSTRYRVVREFAKGGMATVYLGEAAPGDVPVAIKVLDSEVASNLGPARFQREIRIAGALSHPHILPVLDSGEAEGLLFYVMPFVEGESLRQRLEREGQISLSDALGMVRELAGALDYAHQVGVVHRDIKPENILLGPDGVYLADFGIARMVAGDDDDRVTATGHSVGTAAYASPEQAGGDPRFDARSDVYSLGCVLFEMLAGEPPFQGRSPQAVIARHIGQAAPTLSVTRPDLPLSVVVAVKRALAKAPADRFATAGAFVEALEAPQPHPLPGERRRSVLRALGAVGAAVVVAMVAVRLLPSPAEALDPNKVVVLPLATTGEPGDVSAGWDVALAIEAGLEHAEPLKFIDGWARLDDAGRADPASVTVGIARAVALERGAGYYLDGVIRRSVDSTSVVVRLHDVGGDSLVAQETSTGPVGVPPGVLGMRALLELLPRLVDPDRVVRLDALVDRRPAATALFLQGERAYRQFRFEEAMGFYRRALAEDSLHAFAAIKGGMAADWEGDYRDARGLVEVALRNGEMLPAKYLELALGLRAFFEGDAEEARSRLLGAMAVDPDWPEAAGALGEVYTHLLPGDATNPDSIAGAWHSLARDHDAAYAPPLYHLAEIALRRGDLDRVAGLLDVWRRFDPDTVFLKQIEFSMACLSSPPGAYDWSRHTTDHAQSVVMAGASLAGGARQPTCATGALEAITRTDLSAATFQNMAYLGLQGLAMAQGRYGHADSLLQAALAKGVSFAQVYYAYDAVAGAPFAGQAEAYSDVVLDAVAAGAEWPAQGHSWLAGLLSLRRGDMGEVAALSAAVATDPASPFWNAGEALRAHALVVKHDTAGAMTLLATLHPQGDRASLWVTWWQHLGFERLLLAELYLAQGRHRDAYDMAALIDHAAPLTYLPLLPRALALRIKAAEAMNRPEVARQLRVRLEALGWSDPEAVPPTPH